MQGAAARWLDAFRCSLPASISQALLLAVLQLPKRLARRLMDLQFLPHLVVINPHIKKV